MKTPAQKRQKRQPPTGPELLGHAARSIGIRDEMTAETIRKVREFMFGTEGDAQGQKEAINLVMSLYGAWAFSQATGGSHDVGGVADRMHSMRAVSDTTMGRRVTKFLESDYAKRTMGSEKLI